MFSAKSLSEEQVNTIRQWAEEGATMGMIQRNLDEEMGIRLTFMDTRFLIGDLGIALKDEQKEEKPKPAPVDEDGVIDVESEPADESLEPGGEEAIPAPAATGKVTVTLDEIQRPGMIAGGSVTFGDGETAEWYLDQLGRLGLNPAKPGYRPKESDVMAFQRELERVIKQKRLF